MEDGIRLWNRRRAYWGCIGTSVWIVICCGVAVARAEERAHDLSGKVVLAEKPPPRRVLAYYGGTVIPTGDHVIEVLPRSGGWIEAFVMSRWGEPLVPRGIRLTLECSHANDGNVNLRWDPVRGVFAGASADENSALGADALMTMRLARHIHRVPIGMAPVIPRARYGGVVLAVGSAVFELLPRQTGYVEAFPRNQAALRSGAGVELTVWLSGADREPYGARMHWNAKQSKYIGHAMPKAGIRSGPVDAVFVHDGAVERGGIRMAGAVGPARLAASTTLIVGGRTVEIARGLDRDIDAVVTSIDGREEKADTIQLILNAVDTHGNLHPVPMNWDRARQNFHGDLAMKPADVAWWSARVRSSGAGESDPFGALVAWMGTVELKSANAKRGGVAAEVEARKLASGAQEPRPTAPSSSEPEGMPAAKPYVPMPDETSRLGRGNVSGGLRSGPESL